MEIIDLHGVRVFSTATGAVWEGIFLVYPDERDVQEAIHEEFATLPSNDGDRLSELMALKQVVRHAEVMECEVVIADCNIGSITITRLPTFVNLEDGQKFP